jgi:hypothetical protein
MPAMNRVRILHTNGIKLDKPVHLKIISFFRINSVFNWQYE